MISSATVTGWGDADDLLPQLPPRRRRATPSPQLAVGGRFQSPPDRALVACRISRRDWRACTVSSSALTLVHRCGSRIQLALCGQLFTRIRITGGTGIDAARHRRRKASGRPGWTRAAPPVTSPDGAADRRTSASNSWTVRRPARLSILRHQARRTSPAGQFNLLLPVRLRWPSTGQQPGHADEAPGGGPPCSASAAGRQAPRA